MTSKNIEELLRNIMTSENIIIDNKDIKNIIKDDLRKSINNLQKLIFLNRKNIENGKTILKFFLFALLVFLLYCGHEVINNRNPIPFMSKEAPPETKE
jgi:DNA polymerase III delta prime subunit